MKTAAALPVLMYHHICPNPGLVTLTPGNFRAQMRWLAEHGYSTVGCADLAHFIQGQPLPAKSVLITFDDGYLDNYVYAHPILAEFGFKAALFVITGRIGDGAARACAGVGELPETPSHKACMAAITSDRADEVMLRWSEVEKMRAAGTFEFHSHTHTHTRWDQCEPDDAVRRARLAADLAQSRQALQDRIGSTSTHLCWPQGYFDQAYVDVATNCGFTHFYTVIRDTVRPDSAATEIPRIVIKDRGAGWFAPRMWIYRHPIVADAYRQLRGA